MSKSKIAQTSMRRKVIKTIALGGGAATVAITTAHKWTKPMVESVILPAHAETSPSEDPCCDIAGTYCAVVSEQDHPVIIDVASEGTIDITFENPNGIWEGSGSVPCDGGVFDITVLRTDDEENFRIFRGEILCDSDEIINGEFVNQADAETEDITDTFTATMDACNPN